MSPRPRSWRGRFHPAAAAIERSRQAIEGCDDLSATAESRGRVISLRWMLVNMIEEYARHCGHADLVRQSIDGAVGD